MDTKQEVEVGQTKYTLIVKGVHTSDDDGFYACGSGDCPADLMSAIIFAVEDGGGLWLPCAWAAEPTYGYGGTKTWKQIREESFAAGRTIELVDGQWVAKEEDKQESLGDRMKAILMRGDCTPAVQATEKKHPPLPQPEKARFDPFKGFVCEPALTIPEVYEASNPRNAYQRSPDLLKDWTAFEFGSATLHEKK